MPHAARLAALFGDKAIVRRTPKRSMRLRRLIELAPKIFGRDSPLEEDGFEPLWGFSCQVVFWFVGGSLFGARKSFFVPSPAIRFAERAEGVKGPKR